MEKAINQFKEVSVKQTSIPGGGGYGELKDENYFTVYESNIQAKPQILQAVDQTHSFFFYPVRWTPEEAIYDKYKPETFFDKTLDKVSHLIFYLAILFSLASIPFTAFLAFKKEKGI